MIRTILTFAFPLLFLLACNNEKKEYPQTDTEAATTFVRYLLDNKLDEAEAMVLKDEANQQYFSIIRQQYAKRGKAEQDKYHSADIIVNEIGNVSDSVTIVNYSNSVNRKSKNKVKVVRIDGKWVIDLKYTFSGNL